MILSEEEARTKVCPHMSQRGHNFGVRSTTDCLASKCMAWRWARDRSPAELKQRATWNNNPLEPAGYCGV